MKLLENEELLLKLKPHFFSQLGSFLFWFSIIVLSGLSIYDPDIFSKILLKLSVPQAFVNKIPKKLLWSSFLLFPALVRFAPFMKWRNLGGWVIFLAVSQAGFYYFPNISFLPSKIAIGLSIVISSFNGKSTIAK